MRRVLSRVTLPMDWALTPYCRAVESTAASLSGEAETIARAPNSPNSTYSAGAVPATEMDAPSCDAAKQDSAKAAARPPSARSWAECKVPAAASATSESCRRFSAARSMAGGSPATMFARIFEYSEEENSRANSETASGVGRVTIVDTAAADSWPRSEWLACAAPPSRRTIASPSW